LVVFLFIDLSGLLNAFTQEGQQYDTRVNKTIVIHQTRINLSVDLQKQRQSTSN